MRRIKYRYDLHSQNYTKRDHAKAFFFTLVPLYSILNSFFFHILEVRGPLYLAKTQDTLVMRLPFSGIGINWFDSHVWSGTHDRHQFQPGGPTDRLQVRRGQETREGSCLVPSGVLKWRQGRSKVTHVNSCEGKKLQCISHINVATCLSNSLHASLPTFNFLLLFSCLSYDC